MAGLGAIAPAVATASGGDRGADARALRAYHTYLGALVADENSGARIDQDIHDVISADCPRALADLAKLSADQLRRSALSAFAAELDADLSLAYMSVNRPALTRLGEGLAGLRWRSAAPRRSTARFVAAAQAVIAVPAPSLCDDARALDAAPQSEPTSTARFLARYGRASGRLTTALAGFRSVLGRWQTPAESGLIDQIDELAGAYADASSGTVATTAAATLTTLGVPGSPPQQRRR